MPVGPPITYLEEDPLIVIGSRELDQVVGSASVADRHAYTAARHAFTGANAAYRAADAAYKAADKVLEWEGKRLEARNARVGRGIRGLLLFGAGVVAGQIWHAYSTSSASTQGR